MKKIVLAIIIIGLAVGAYFLFFAQSKPDLSAAYNAFRAKIDAIGKVAQDTVNTYDAASNLVGSGLKKLNDIGNFVNSVPGAVSTTISDIKNNIPPGAIDVINALGGLNKQSLNSFIYSNSSTSGQAPDLRGDVCVQFASGQQVAYKLNNPFSPPKDYNYSIDWGDGVKNSGTSLANDPQTALAHTYTATGNYANTFKISGASSTLSAEVRVCIH